MYRFQKPKMSDFPSPFCLPHCCLQVVGVYVCGTDCGGKYNMSEHQMLFADKPRHATITCAKNRSVKILHEHYYTLL